MIISTFLAFTLNTGINPFGKPAPWVQCYDGSAAHGACPVAGSPAPPAWLGVAGLIGVSRRIRQRMKDGQP